jgi:hypothetical protein
VRFTYGEATTDPTFYLPLAKDAEIRNLESFAENVIAKL